MPFGSHRIPKLGLALLKSYLKRDAVKCDVHLFDLVFAFQIGLDNYEIIAENFDPALLIGEWFFAKELFGADLKADREYVNLLLSDISKKKDAVALPVILKLLEIRDKIPGFLRDCLNSVNWSKYLIVGFNASNQQNCSCLALAKLIKDSYPHIKIVFGGAGCSGAMAEAMIRSFPFIDYICQGEGDISFPLLVNSLLQKKQVEPGQIPGILCRCENKSNLYCEKVSSVSDLDTLPYPDFSEYFSYLKENGMFDMHIPLETSRGCWWGEVNRCTFCSHCINPDMVFKSKSPQRVMKEVNYLSRKYINTFRIADDILDYKYYNTLLPKLAKEKSNITFLWEVKANITKERMVILSNANVKRIQPGIESLGDNTLKLMNKGTNRLINISTLKWAKEFDVHAYWNFIYGFPGEDPSEYDEIIKLIPLLYHLEPPFGFSHIRFERFSNYVNNPAYFGIKSLKPSKIYNLIFRELDKDNINDIAFYFDAEYEDRSGKYEAKLLEAVAEWRIRRDAALDVFSYDDSIKIVDTRDLKNNRELSFKGIKSRIYLSCDSAKSISLLINEPEITRGIGEKEIKTILDDFVKEGLMIESRGRYLSLAVMR